MDRLDKLLPSVLRKRGLFQQAQASHAVHAAALWITDVLPGFADFLRPTSLRDGILHIEGDHPIALQELSMKSGDLLSSLHERGHSNVTEISIVRSRGQS